MSIPFVIEKGPNDQERVYDLYSRLLRDRIIFIKGEFNQEMADAVVAQLLFLESSDSDSDIYIYINSPGGHITALYAIFDVMQYINPDIVTVGMGMCASAASFILAAGTNGKRFALPNTEVMIHELSGGFQGKAQEMFNKIEHTKKLYDKMAKHYVNFTGQKLAKIKADMKKDFYMSAEEAKDYGLIDKIHAKRS